jgi:FkbM family methyltransferase
LLQLWVARNARRPKLQAQYLHPEDRMIRILSGIARHPLNRRRPIAALGRFFAWQFGTRLLGAPVAVPFVGATRLLVRRGMAGASGNVYYGLQEFEDMAFVVHALRPGDVFVDVGANVGAYTILAAGVSGANCVALEPVPRTFGSLLDNVRLNDLMSRVVCRNVAAGSAEGTLAFTADLDALNHAVAQNESSKSVLNVPVTTLDTILRETLPTLIKIDVEGFETRVIEGAEQTLRRPSLLAVLMELNGSGTRYGFSEGLLHERMLSLGFAAAAYDPVARLLSKRQLNAKRDGNLLYIRRWSDVESRLTTAARVQVRGASL